VTTQGTFTGNVSIRNQPGEYDDAVTGNVDNTNYFIAKGKSVNSEGKELDKTQVKM